MNCRSRVFIGVMALLLGATPGQADTHYVWRNNPSAPVPPFTGGWASAATNIQDALDWAVSNDVVLVASGVYNTGGRSNWPAGSALTNRVAISNAVTVRAVSANPADTLIVGAPDPGTGSNGPSAVRCVYLAANSSLIGFTLTNGYTMATNLANSQGAGAYCASAVSSVLSNCVITSCRAFYYGGGAYQGYLTGCVVSNNIGGDRGGGVAYSTLRDSVIVGNTVGHFGVWISGNEEGGGGMFGGSGVNSRILNNHAPVRNGAGCNQSTLSGCIVSGNIQSGSIIGGFGGAGIYKGSGTNCIITCNVASNIARRGGGIEGDGSTFVGCLIASNKVYGAGGGIGLIAGSCVLSNCVIRENEATAGQGAIGVYQTPGIVYAYNCLIVGNRGGGAACNQCVLINCTVVSNTSGGTASYTNFNSIISGNTPWDVSSLSMESNSFYSCITSNSAGIDHVAGNNNIYDVSPQFADANAGDYRLRNISPCVNKGMNNHWMTNAVDLGGLRRIIDGIVDMGAYEFLPRGTHCCPV